MFKLRDLNHPLALAAALVVVGLGMLAPGPKDVIGNILKAQFGVHEDTPWWVGLILSARRTHVADRVFLAWV
jgi:hypothetical protein